MWATLTISPSALHKQERCKCRAVDLVIYRRTSLCTNVQVDLRRDHFDPIWSKQIRAGCSQIIIYGELFGSSIHAALEPTLGHSRFELDMRMDFIKSCIPDPVCWFAYEGLEIPSVGPYVSRDPLIIVKIDLDQVRLNHILNCRTWCEAWKTVFRQIGPRL